MAQLADLYSFFIYDSAITQVPNTVLLATSSVDDEVVSSVRFRAAPIKRTTATISTNLDGSKLQIEFPSANTLLRRLINTGRGSQQSVTISQRLGEMDIQHIWQGRLVSQSMSGQLVQNNYAGGVAALARTGRRKRFQRRCPYSLYDPLTCRAERGTGVSGTIISKTEEGLTIDVEGLAEESGWATGGLIGQGNESNNYVRVHTKLSDTRGRLLLAAPTSFEHNDSIVVWRGCDRTWQTCLVVFDNIANYGGYPFAPQEDPYSFSIKGDTSTSA